MFLLRQLTPGMQYILRIQHSKNRILSEFNDKRFRTKESYETPSLNVVWITDFNAVFNWEHTKFHTSNQNYIFQWRRVDQA